jgi:hypothetical protein
VAGRGFNIFCLAGLVLAVFPIAISWVSANNSLPLDVGRHVSAIEIITGKVTSGCPCLLVSSTIFVVATAFLLVSPLGSLFQIIGIGVFLIRAPFNLYCAGAYCVWTGTAGIGIVVACAASILPLIGIVRPWGVTRNLKLAPLKERFVTFGLVADGTGKLEK